MRLLTNLLLFATIITLSVLLVINLTNDDETSTEKEIIEVITETETDTRGPPEGENPCHKKKPDSVQYFDDDVCILDGDVNVLEQSGTNVTVGYKGEMNTSTPFERKPITEPFYKVGLCPVNVHWHLGAEHLSVGEYDLEGTGPTPIEYRRKMAGKVRQGNLCHYYDENDERYTTEYNWKHCIDMEVGQTYEVHWPHSAAGACGTVDQYQSPFYDGVFCKDNILSLDPVNTYEKIGVQGQIFTVINDEDYYYPNLFHGMIVDEGNDIGTHMTKYTGSTTGTKRNNSICSKYTPITWQVDRKCHLVSASSFDKLCADMKMQRDDMTMDLHAHGARIVVTDNLAADNHENRWLRH